MSRPCADSAAVGAELLATVAVAVTVCRRHLTDPDPKTALRAVAELAKLLGVCARHGLAVEATDEAKLVPPPAPVPAATDSARVADSRRESERSQSLPAVATHANESASSRVADSRRESVLSAEESLPAGATHPLGRGSPAPLHGGKRLTSFLGSAGAKQEAG